MSYLIRPEGYRPLLDQRQTELAIKQIKDFFQLNLSSELRLRRVTAPLFVLKGMGINDDLNGVERPVSFRIKDMADAEAEVVHSLAKWKRLTLAEYGIEPGYGIYTDMNAIRADEELGNLHSLYVDQWDWERVIMETDRNVAFLKKTVRSIYSSMVRTEYMVCEMYPQITPMLPREEGLLFIHSEHLRQRYPDLSPKEREDMVAREYGAVFIIGIGGRLGDGTRHDGRAPDYDDWSTVAEDSPAVCPISGTEPAAFVTEDSPLDSRPTETGPAASLSRLAGLNGDLIVWNDVLKRSFEVSSMGIRVDKAALLRQLKEACQEERLGLYYHRQLMSDTLSLSIGGGIGQSRLCMLLLRKAHIGEIQASIWPAEMRRACVDAGIPLI
ncbi:MAG: aspartate--ammonia ligase [Bacteroidetes bacterium]|uniref:Aspartate--ammonia ligase n=1 Tax=Candidatus Cryptobacteroides intestinavium TaxID=2840766 RepID=A0A9D9ERJ7_9BACT|nr:aspartate--ammonia ligase [Candidatus Cryptobacteroides intestinavium]